MPPRLLAASSEADLAAARGLLLAYERSVGVDLTYQGFASELASLPGRYSPPLGALLLAQARPDSEPCGCVALRALPMPGICEMKRLFVAPSARGLGLGRFLADAAVSQARRLGYTKLVLDTLPSMREAIALYQALGFTRVAEYYETPIAETLFLGIDL